MEDESNIRLAYATHEDIAACCPAETVLAVRVREPCANFSIIILFKMKFIAAYLCLSQLANSGSVFLTLFLTPGPFRHSA